MKKLIFMLLGFTILGYAETLQYQFPMLENIVYNVHIDGNAGWSSFDEKPLSFKVKADFRLELLNLGESNGLYQIKLTVRKSKILINNDVLEDISKSETEISFCIPQVLVQMDKNGKIYKTTTLKKGLINIAPFFNILPAFPGEIKQGSKWVQKIESFNLPSGKVPQLEFTYIYEGKSGDNHRIRFLSNQTIKEITNQQDTEVRITGKNSSDGDIIFDSQKNILKKATGKINLDMNYMFQVPDPDKKGKFIPVPMKTQINLNFSFNSIQTK
jgi:hypothetical protein